MITKPQGPFVSDGEIASKMEVWGDSLEARVIRLEAVLTRLKREPKLWKVGGVGGQDQFAGLPPAVRLIHEVLPD